MKRRRGAQCGTFAAGLRSGLVPILVAGLWSVLASSCTTAPVGKPHPTESRASVQPESTSLGRLVAAGEQAHPDRSGFELVASGREAFEGRYALAEHAEKTIDAQYFIWENDASGRRLLAALVEAAERGVRVRLLLDDLNLSGRDHQLALIGAHPNIQVRLFNPFGSRWSHLPDFLFDLARVNHRMHNKAFIADNAVAVVGGRNIGDAYFSVSGAGANFRDLDLFTAGPIVRDVSRNFDEFWNSRWSTPIHAVDPEHPGPAQWSQLAEKLRQPVPRNPAFPFDADLNPAFLQKLVQGLPRRLVWAEAMLLADDPDKPVTSESKITEALRAHIGDTVSRDLVIESAYFIPAGGRAERYCALTRRGVRVRVLTNSLASNDETSAFAGYSKYREQLLRCGVQLFELRADASFIHREWKWLNGHSQAELHSKAVVFDGEEVLLGSYNLDPRSKELNTEMALLIDSAALAGRLGKLIEGDMAPDNAWALRLDPHGNIVWVGQNQGRTITLTHEPDAKLLRRSGAKFLSLLPIDGLL